MGHPQPATPPQTDNDTASGIVNETIQQKYSKSIDICVYWLKDHIQKGQFHVFWSLRPTNLFDYRTKHHRTSHNCENEVHLTSIQFPFLQSNISVPGHLKGCVDTSPRIQVPKGNTEIKGNPETCIQ